ncbi:XRE family transcriptional regulator [Actinoplanes sp. N902-109]|nr:XRE family transcriptional regulator [Actinoplanes sp. N902-109]
MYDGEDDDRDMNESGNAASEVLDALGERLRRRRQDRAMTLADLAAATGVSESLLSRLETGRRRPTVDVLLQLARIHQVTLDDLVGAPATADPRVHPRPSQRFGMTWLPLTGRPGGIQAYKLIIPAGFGGSQPEQRSHEGYEWLYVLAGRLRLLLGEHDLVLAAGEVAEFDTHTPHAFTNTTDTATEVLMLIGPQGERAHVRAHPAPKKAGP